MVMERRPRRRWGKDTHSEQRECGVATAGMGRDTTRRHVPSERKSKVRMFNFPLSVSGMRETGSLFSYKVDSPFKLNYQVWAKR